MFKCQKNKLRLDKKQYRFLLDMTHRSKNLFNATLYETRQHFFRCGQFLNYNSAYHVMKEHEAYKALPTDPAGQTMKVVERCFRSFFGLLKKKQGGNYNRPVKLPKYLDKEGHFILIFPIRKGRCKDNFTIRVPKDMQEKYRMKDFVYPVPPNVKGHKIKEVRILPKLDYFEIEFVYEVEEKRPKLHKRRVLAIDLGVDNFATCLDNKSGRSFILDGKEMKSINRFFNKTKGYLQSILDHQGKKWSKRLNRFSAKRSRMLNEYLNQYVNLIVQTCLTHKIGKVVVGEGWLAQDGSNIGKRNNQNFVNLPFGKFVWKLQAKCKEYGIECMTTEESYTSKCDHLAGESMKHQEKYLGRRSPRGLFHSSTGVTINADMNGALGILLKTSNQKSLLTQLRSGGVTPPRRIRLREIQQTSSVRLAENILA